MPISPKSIELDKVVYAYLLSFQNQEELVVTDYQQKSAVSPGDNASFCTSIAGSALE